jgi:hypothetical protein
MTHVICRASSCMLWEDGVCTSEEIEYEPDVGCLTFQDVGDLELDEDEEYDWDDKVGDLFADDEDWDEDDEEDEEDDDWDDL